MNIGDKQSVPRQRSIPICLLPVFQHVIFSLDGLLAARHIDDVSIPMVVNATFLRSSHRFHVGNLLRIRQYDRFYPSRAPSFESRISSRFISCIHFRPVAMSSVPFAIVTTTIHQVPRGHSVIDVCDIVHIGITHGHVL